jgi:hypothetical protein
MAGAFAPQVQGLGTEDPMAWLEKLYGPVTPRSQAGLMPETASLTSLEEDPRVTELRQPGAAEGAFGIMGDVAMQPVRAGEAVGEAIFDPTLANVTNAGTQAALTFGKPYAAAGTAGLGMLEALRRDLGATMTDPAYAGAKLTRRQQREMEMKRQEEDAKAAADLKRIEAQGKANAQLEADKMRIIEEGKKEASKREEYDRAVTKAEGVRDKELSRVKRFSDTTAGEVYDKLGGFAPVLAAMGLGGIHRFATGGGGGFLNKYAAPAVEGTGGAFLAMNAPMIYEGYGGVDSDNPEKAAFAAYSRELPPGHPRKEEYKQLADELPYINPIQKNAQDNFVNGMPGRLVSSVVEGGLAGASGANIGRVLGRVFGQKAPDLEVKAKVPGRVSKWLDKHFPSGSSTAAPAAAGPVTTPPKAAVAAKAKTRGTGNKGGLVWNEASKRYHAPNGDFAKGGKPPE